MLALTFKNPDDFDRLHSGDKVTLKNLDKFAANEPVTAQVTTKDGSFDIELGHSFNSEQVAWFRHGSALNAIRQANKVSFTTRCAWEYLT